MGRERDWVSWNPGLPQGPPRWASPRRQECSFTAGSTYPMRPAISAKPEGRGCICPLDLPSPFTGLLMFSIPMNNLRIGRTAGDIVAALPSPEPDWSRAPRAPDTPTPLLPQNTALDLSRPESYIHLVMVINLGWHSYLIWIRVRLRNRLRITGQRYFSRAREWENNYLCWGPRKKNWASARCVFGVSSRS